MKEFMSKAKKPMIFIILAALIVGYYFYLSNRKVDNNDSIAKKTPLTEITDRDLDKKLSRHTKIRSNILQQYS